jgi:hypothetical protein
VIGRAAPARTAVKEHYRRPARVPALLPVHRVRRVEGETTAAIGHERRLQVVLARQRARRGPG